MKKGLFSIITILVMLLSTSQVAMAAYILYEPQTQTEYNAYNEVIATECYEWYDGASTGSSADFKIRPYGGFMNPKNNCWIRYKDMNFGEGASAVKFKYAHIAARPGSIEFIKDPTFDDAGRITDGTILASISGSSLSTTGSPYSWEETEAFELTNPDEAAGTFDLYIRFTGPFYNFYSFEFMGQCTYRFEDTDGTVLKEETVDFGTEIVPPENPSDKDPYIFDYWENYSDGMLIEDDITFTAVYKYKAYDITVDGLTETVNVVYGDSFTITPQERESYVFAGYYTEENGGGVQLTDDIGNSLGYYNFTENITAYPYFVYNVAFDYTISNGEVTITDCPTTFTRIVIPEAIDGYPVTSIGDYAFSDCDRLTSITIPDSVASIGKYVFSGCSSLTNVIIGNGVTDIGDYTFYDCSSLTGVIIGNSVTSIGDYAFRDCSSLAEIIIPDCVTSIGEGSFSNCGNLTGVIIGDGVANIGDSAFYCCTGLTYVTIGDSVTSIGDYAFSYCNRLEYITIPDNVTSLGDYVFYYCRGLTNITIGNGVTSVGDSAFYYCTGLTDVTIGDSVTSIGDRAFYYCSNLTSIVIPDSVTNIENYAFHYCRSLADITIGNGVTSIGNYAFYKCYNLISITVDENNEYYSSEDGILFNKDKTTLIRYASGKADTFYTIPDNVTSIGAYAFSDCNNLTDITIGDSVANIGIGAFEYCRSLTSVTIPDGVTNIRLYAFFWCDNLTSVTIPDGVTNIGGYSFGNCTSLTSITIPDSVTSIGSNAFANCSSLETVYYNGTKEAWKEISIGSHNTELMGAARFYSYSEKSISATVSEDGKAFTVTPVNIESGNTVILALYNNGLFVGMQSAEYDGEQLTFTTDKNYTEAKVMVWESLTNLIPVCEAETI